MSCHDGDGDGGGYDSDYKEVDDQTLTCVAEAVEQNHDSQQVNHNICFITRDISLLGGWLHTTTHEIRNHYSIGELCCHYSFTACSITVIRDRPDP